MNHCRSFLLQFACVMLLSPTCASWADFNAGVEAIERKDYATAFKEFTIEARKGDKSAQYNLGNIYYNGLGTPQNFTEAAKWYRKAADQHHTKAQYNLGNMHYSGQGIPYDYTEAAKWYRKAADQGHAKAQYNLGQMYRIGKGVPQDYVETVKWYRKAADQGHAPSQYNLGVMYSNGHGVPQDKVRALMWLHLASSVSDPRVSGLAAKSRDKVASSLNSNQIGEAQRLAREWKPKQPEHR